MHFAIIAKDVPGEDTLGRRLAARAEHMRGLKRRKGEGSIIDGGAMLDDAGNMVGSVVLCEFPDRAALDAYLAEEIYAREGVWGELTIYPLRRVDWQRLMQDEA